MSKCVIKVLVIEDSDDDYEAAERALCGPSRGRYRIEPARSSSIQHAQALLNNTFFDLVLLDLSLPDCQGIDALTKLRSVNAEIPIVVLTGLDDDARARLALEQGAQDYLVKGAESFDLHRIVRYSIQRNETRIELERARNDAIAASRARTAFLANMSHEIRTPLTAILGFTQIALEKCTDPEQKAALEVVSRNTEHLQHLVTDILDLSKIESAGFELDLVTTPFFQLLEDLEKTFALRASAKGLYFRVDYNFPLPSRMETDPLRLKQILYNLVGNAIKFTSSGGVVVTVSYSESEGILTIDISDSGIGLSPEEISKLFQPFRQADSSTSRNYGGTGLGLNISKKLAEMFSGSISVTSTKGAGSTFSVVLPVSKVEELVDVLPQVVTEDSRPKDIAPQLGGKVLVVDDMPDNRAYMSHYLKNCNCEVVTASNGMDAVSLVQEEGFDLILMDMHMPLLDGYDSVQLMREDGCAVPVVAVSGDVLEASIEKCLQAGCTDYLSKPFSVQRFYEILSRFLSSAERVSEDSQKQKDTQSELDRIVAAYKKRIPERVAFVRSCFEQGDWGNLSKEAHSLAAAGMFGYSKLGELSRFINEALMVDDYTSVGPLIEQLESEVETLNS